MTREKILFLIFIICLGDAYASENKGKAIVFAGSIGPLFVVQTGYSASFSYYLNNAISLDIESGTYLTNSISPFYDENFSSIGGSYYLPKDILPDALTSPDSGIFIRSSYSYHDRFKRIDHDDKNIGRKISNGFEQSFGIRAIRDSIALELIPMTFYFPLDVKKSGDSSGNHSLTRVLSLKLGYSF